MSNTKESKNFNLDASNQIGAHPASNVIDRQPEQKVQTEFCPICKMNLLEMSEMENDIDGNLSFQNLKCSSCGYVLQKRIYWGWYIWAKIV